MFIYSGHIYFYLRIEPPVITTRKELKKDTVKEANKKEEGN